MLTDPTTGGVTASYAMLGDIHIAEPGALICFAGPRVIQQTIREQLPDGFQRAEYLLAHGMIDMVVHRHKLRETLAASAAMHDAARRPASSDDGTKQLNGKTHYVNGSAGRRQVDRDGAHGIRRQSIEPEIRRPPRSASSRRARAARQARSATMRRRRTRSLKDRQH